MSWTVIYRDSAKKSLERIRKGNAKLAEQIAEKVALLASNPYPSGVTKLGGKEDYYRIQVRTFRIVYQVSKGILQVLIIEIGPRGDIYGKLR